MKSNIGFVFVVNSEKAFGRFVKESAGEEEMKSCKRRVEDFSSRATSNCRLDVESLVESETSLVKLFDKICRGSEFLIFYLVHQTKYLVFFLSPPQKNVFFYISRWRLPIVSQVSQSLLPTLWGELSLACSVMGPSWGGCYFYLGIFCALPIVTDSDM